MKISKEQIKTYIIIVFITYAFFMFTFEGSSNAEFINLFSFGSTITSVILAIMAIIYAYVDSKASNEVNIKLISSTEEIKSSVSKLSDIKNEFEKFSKDFGKKVNELQEDVKYNNDYVKELAYSMEEKNKIFKESTNDWSEEKLNEIINSFTLDVKRNCLILLKAYEDEKTFDIEDYDKFYNESLIADDLPSNSMRNSFFNTLDILSSFGLVKYSFLHEINLIIVQDMNKEFKNSLENNLTKEGEYEDARDLREMGCVYKYFKNEDM